MAKFNCHIAACPSRNVLAQVSGKWTVLVLTILVEGTTRFNELRRQVDGITQKVLTQTLRDLERQGLVTREIFAEVPPRVEYSLTSLGRSLVAVLDEVRAWADAHTREVLAAEKRFDEQQQLAALKATETAQRMSKGKFLRSA